NTADGTGHRISITMSPTRSEHRTGIHAGSATDAFQRLPEILHAQMGRSAVVHQNQMHFTAFPGSLVVTGISGNPLSGGATGQQPDEYPQIPLSGNQFFDAHTMDLDRGFVDTQVGIALIGTYRDRSGLSHPKIDSCNSCLSVHKFFP